MWVRNPTYLKRRQSQQIVWFSTSMRMYAAKHSIKSAILCSTIFINIRFHTRKTREKHFAYANREPETEKQTERQIQKANERMNDDNKKVSRTFDVYFLFNFGPIFMYGWPFLSWFELNTRCLLVPCGERFWWMWNMCMKAADFSLSLFFFSTRVALQLVSYYSFIRIVCPIELPLLLWT